MQKQDAHARHFYMMSVGGTIRNITLWCHVDMNPLMTLIGSMNLPLQSSGSRDPIQLLTI